jgi:hypothetical protein
MLKGAFRLAFALVADARSFFLLQQIYREHPMKRANKHAEDEE